MGDDNIKIQKIDRYFLILFIILTAITDIFVKPILYSESSTLELVITDILILSLSGWIGLKLASKEKMVTFLPKRTLSDISQNIPIRYFIIALTLIALNTIVWQIYSRSATVIPNWAYHMSPIIAIIISIRASLVEEIVFRLFTIAFIIFSLRQMSIISRYNKHISVFVASILFSFICHDGSMISILSGIFLGAIFLEFGLIFAIFVHFFADAIPFIILSIR